MYGKIFDSIYDGTLVEDWRALITFQQMIVLCDADGTVDMTPHAISRRTGIPIEHIEAGIKVLENPDPYSRTDVDEGRRVVRLDEHRPWGWSIVNHSKYKHMQDSDTIRAQTRERVRAHRERNALKRPVTDGNGQKRYTNTNTDTKTHTDDFIVLEFEKFWSAYPRRDGDNPKKPARLLFTSLVKKGADTKLVISGAEKYAKECTTVKDRKYVAQAVTWLRQERWADNKKTEDQFKGAI